MCPKRSSRLSELRQLSLEILQRLLERGAAKRRLRCGQLALDTPARQLQAIALPLELQIAELVREKALELTKEEVPHSISVELHEIEEKVVRAALLVETESQKGILVGKRGAMVREIGSRARPEIEHLLGRKVFLQLTVKVKPKWRRDETTLERLGL